jgi:hypothetical protein
MKFGALFSKIRPSCLSPPADADADGKEGISRGAREKKTAPSGAHCIGLLEAMGRVTIISGWGFA